MAQRKISELPVVDGDGRPVGLIDVTDVVGLFPQVAGESRGTAPCGEFRHRRRLSGSRSPGFSLNARKKSAAGRMKAELRTPVYNGVP